MYITSVFEHCRLVDNVRDVAWPKTEICFTT